MKPPLDFKLKLLRETRLSWVFEGSSGCGSLEQNRVQGPGPGPGPGYSKTAAAPMPVPMHMDTTPYALWRQRRQPGSGSPAPPGPAPPPSSAPEFVEQRDHLAGPRAAQRVSQGDGPPVGVHLVHWDSQRLHTVHSLGGEGGASGRSWCGWSLEGAGLT